MGLSNAEATGAGRGVGPVTSGGASPRPRAWHLGQKRQCAETQTSCHSCTPCQAWHPPTAAGVAAASPRALVLARAGPAVSRHSASQCEQEAGLVSALARVISRWQLHVHRAEGSVFLSSRSAASPPESHDWLHQKLALMMTCLLVEAVPGWACLET